MVDLPAADLLQDEIKNTRILIVNWKSYRQRYIQKSFDFLTHTRKITNYLFT